MIAVDPETGARRSLLDVELVRKAIRQLTDPTLDGAGLPFTRFRWVATDTVEFDLDDRTYVVDVPTSQVTPLSADDQAARDRARRRVLRPGFLANTAPVREVPSPGGDLLAHERDHDLWLRRAADDTLERLTHDGEPDQRWDVEFARWSGEGTYLAAMRRDTRGVERLGVVHWLEPSERVDWYPYPRTGGSYQRTTLHVFDVDARTSVCADLGDDELYWISLAGKLGRELLVLTVDRYDKVLTLHAVDPATGATRLVVEERQDTFVYGIRVPHILSSVVHLPDDELVWFSERDGWRHAYRYGADGTLINRITSGDFEIERVAGVDAANGVVFVLAHSDRSRPYDVHLCSVRLDDPTSVSSAPTRGCTPRTCRRPAMSSSTRTRACTGPRERTCSAVTARALPRSRTPISTGRRTSTWATRRRSPRRRWTARRSCRVSSGIRPVST